MQVVSTLESGAFPMSDLDALAQVDTTDLLSEIREKYPIEFLDARQGHKQELGVAQRRRQNTYRECVFLTLERGRLTTIAIASFIRVKPSEESGGEVRLTTGGGLSLYHDPDGWSVKYLQERTISLSKEKLKERGWRLNDS